MQKRILLIILVSIASLVTYGMNPRITDSLTYYSKTEYGNSSFRQDYRIKLDSTLTSKAQRIHALHLIGEIYIS
ncbi:MAG: hypothetical protein ACRDD8_08420, partial [Bacteroidales bacterium]